MAEIKSLTPSNKLPFTKIFYGHLLLTTTYSTGHSKNLLMSTGALPHAEAPVSGSVTLARVLFPNFCQDLTNFLRGAELFLKR
jgi:hypothetical protein